MPIHSRGSTRLKGEESLSLNLSPTNEEGQGIQTNNQAFLPIFIYR